MKISVYIEALTGAFETDINRVRKSADKAFKQMKVDAAAAGKVIGGALVVAGGAAAVAIKSAIDEMDRTSKSAQKIGIATEALSALEYAAKLADVSAESLQTGMTKLIKTQADAARGSKQQADLFQRLGIAYKETDGTLRAGDKVLADLADRFASMPDGAEKTAIAVELLGRSGANMIPLLNGGSQALRTAGDEARAFGLVVSTEAGRAAEEFNDNLTRLGSAVKGAALDVAQDLLPTLNDLSDQVVEMAKDPAFREDVANAIRVIGEAALGATKLLVNFASAMGYVYDEARQFYGFIDSDDLVRLNEQLEYASDNAERLARAFELAPNAGGAGALARAREEVALLEAQIASAEKKLLSSALIQPIDLNTLAKRKPVAGVGPVFTPTAAPEKHSLGYAKALMDESDAIMAEMQAAADERARAFESVQQIKFGLLDQEGQAVARLQAQYIDLQNAVAAGGVSQQAAAEVSAGLAAQWADEQAARQQAERDSLYNGLLTEEEWIQASYDRRSEAILESTAITEAERTDLMARAEDERTAMLVAAEQARADARLGLASQFFGDLASLSSASNSKLAAIGKAAAIAQATIDGYQMVQKALASAPYPYNIALGIAAGAQAAVQIAGIASTNYAGAYDSGGAIPSGSFGLVGERGPELVSGPANVTSRVDTAKLLNRAGDDARITVIPVFDAEHVGEVVSRSRGMERAVIAHIDRNRSALRLPARTS